MTGVVIRGLSPVLISLPNCVPTSVLTGISKEVLIGVIISILPALRKQNLLGVNQARRNELVYQMNQSGENGLYYSKFG